MHLCIADVTLKTPLPNFKTRPQGGFFRFRESVHFFPLFVTGLNQWRFQVENFEQILRKTEICSLFQGVAQVAKNEQGILGFGKWWLELPVSKDVNNNET